MNTKLVLTLTAIIAALVIYKIEFIGSNITQTTDVDMVTVQKFQIWKQKMEKHYNTPEEEKYRLSVFADTVKEINTRNSDPTETAFFAVNEFSDLTSEEFLIKYGSQNRKNVDFLELKNSLIFQKKVNVSNLPAQIDWRTRGIITPVQNQGVCGAGYAFAVADALASVHCLDKQDLWDLSKQELVDCSMSYGNHGCSGGSILSSYKYVMDFGLSLTSAYPYTAIASSCNRPTSGFKYKPDQYRVLPTNDNDALLQAVNYVPTATGLDASTLKSYSSGIISSNCGTDLNHDMLVIGYGTYVSSSENTSTDYWLLKNSWGSKWGEQGYIKIKRTPGVAQAVCNMSASAIFPWVVYVQ